MIYDVCLHFVVIWYTLNVILCYISLLLLWCSKAVDIMCIRFSQCSCNTVLSVSVCRSIYLRSFLLSIHFAIHTLAIHFAIHIVLHNTIQINKSTFHYYYIPIFLFVLLNCYTFIYIYIYTYSIVFLCIFWNIKMIRFVKNILNIYNVFSYFYFFIYIFLLTNIFSKLCYLLLQLT